MTTRHFENFYASRGKATPAKRYITRHITRLLACSKQNDAASHRLRRVASHCLNVRQINAQQALCLLKLNIGRNYFSSPRLLEDVIQSFIALKLIETAKRS